MSPSYLIEIIGLDNPTEFVDKWSKSQDFRNEQIYTSCIDSALDDETSFINLYKWKNGTGDKIEAKKMKNVTVWKNQRDFHKSLRKNFSWDNFEGEYHPTRNATIWKIFLLHLIKPDDFPIFDQHVYRFYFFVQMGIIKEIPTKLPEVYSTYKNEYRPWFNNLKSEYKLNHVEMDRAFWAFGKFLKSIKRLPIVIKK